MGNLGERSYDNARSGHLRAPAQIQVLAEGGDEWIKATKCGKEVRTNKGHAAGRHEDVSLAVLLTVIYLS